jgi:hypothetical protein
MRYLPSRHSLAHLQVLFVAPASIALVDFDYLGQVLYMLANFLSDKPVQAELCLPPTFHSLHPLNETRNHLLLAPVVGWQVVGLWVAAALSFALSDVLRLLALCVPPRLLSLLSLQLLRQAAPCPHMSLQTHLVLPLPSREQILSVSSYPQQFQESPLQDRSLVC